MPVEFKGALLPNSESIEVFEKTEQSAVILKPQFSWGVLVTINDMPTEETKEEWVGKVDLLLQHGVDVLVAQERVNLDNIEGYHLLYAPENSSLESIKEFLIENNIEALDGTTR
ncbi:MAG: hypothetical protein US96_C0039G0002 [Candidatus Woesebacteria bacterium GW2011_GWB1_38_5b]|uniref:Uncharacterized protein n=1 Tax=Candidatus Woesebacteria bacterium GW2011_GWB1_38_5b TaxID=1618569 RepID=A0A0G0NAP7_9BACT|nr:MAG: hypothetical protein US96_C0039G0002 [Candidatus Woesebacteria bacterium GW2011_GWB1_38_5b]